MNNKLIIKIVIAALIIIVIGLIACIVLYINTDLLKPNSKLFQKYIEQSGEQINNILDFSTEKEYISVLKENKYTDNTQVLLKYTNNQNKEEIFNINSTGSTDSENKNSYRTINVKYGNSTDVINLEFLQENEMYGILFSDLVQQFVNIDTSDADDLLNNLDLNLDKYKKYDYRNEFDIISNKKEDIEDIFSKYIKNIDKEQYSAQSEKMITLSNGKSITTQSYTLTLNSSQSKKLATQIFEKLNYSDLIDKMTTENGEFPELTIVEYVLEGNTYRVTLELGNYTIKIDLMENTLNFEYNKVEDDENKTYTYNFEKLENKMILKYTDYKENSIDLSVSINKNDNNYNGEFDFSINTQNIKGVTVDVIQNLQVADTVEIAKNFASQKVVLLNNLNTETLDSALYDLLKKIDNKILNVQQNKSSELLNLFLEKTDTLESKYQGLKQKEIKDFNNKFLTYRGNNVDKSIMYNLIDLAGKNMQSYQLNGKNKITIYIEEKKDNTSMIKEIKENIEEMEYDNYSVSFEYDSKGKINRIIIENYDDET